MSGRVVMRPYQNKLSAGNQVITFSIAALPKGSYFYTVSTTENGEIRKIAKQLVKI
jgi:hypothetical protein